jgi:PAS domain S-box-containing protein
MSGFAGQARSADFIAICGQHGRVIPDEHYLTLENSDDHLAIALLQQKASSLEAEVTERKHAEKRVRIAENHYRHLFEASSDGILLADPESGKVINANFRSTELLGLSREQLVGQDLCQIGLFRDRTPKWKAVEDLAGNWVIRDQFLAVQLTDGRQRDIELVANRYRSNGHDVVQWNLRDITQRRQAEALRQHFAAIVKSSNDAIKTLDGLITSWNLAAERVFGYTFEEVIGRPISLLCPAERPDEIPRMLERLKQGARIEHFETVCRRKDGRRINVSLIISPIRDEAGQIIGASEIARDITEQKRIEEQLREDVRIIETLHHIGITLTAELDLRAIVQAVTDAGTAVTHAEFGSFFYNVENDQGESYMLYTLSGADPEEFSSLPIPCTTPLFVPTFEGTEVIRLDDVTTDPRFGQNPPYHGMLPGHLSVRSYLAVPVISRSGQVLGGLFFGHSEPGVFTEQDERLAVGIAGQAAIDNGPLYEEAQRAIHVRDEFLSLASHELKTPLTTLKGATHLLTRHLRQPDLDRTRLSGYADRLRVQLNRLEHLVTDLLDASRIQQGRLELRPEACDLREIAREVLARCQEASERNERHRLVIAAPDPVRAVIDSDRIDQVLTNLVSNALKYSPDGGEVRLAVDRLDGHATIAVSNQGIGISSEDQARLFQPFARSDAVRGSVSGSGLGLHILRQIVEQHGGLITVESEAGSGITFTIQLPCETELRKQRSHGLRNEGPRDSLHAVVDSSPARYVDRNQRSRMDAPHTLPGLCRAVTNRPIHHSS